jgi:hypothetical protein
MKGELFDFADWDTGRIEGFPTLFSVGNVVTGKGNIVASRKHAAHVSEEAIESFLGLDGNADHEGEADADSRAAVAARESADHVHSQLGVPPSPDVFAEILRRVEERQRAVDYPGDYKVWIESVAVPA